MEKDSNLLDRLRVKASEDKTVSSTQTIEFLGTWFDALKQTMAVTLERLVELMEELQMWSTKTVATRKEVESLVGKLNFIYQCVKQSRMFLSRILNWLGTMEKGKLCSS